MQQLTYTLVHDDSVITVVPSPPVYWDDFSAFVSKLLSGLDDHSVLEHASGADRHQLHLRWRDVDYLLQYEGYGNVIWFECLTPDADNINRLYQHLSAAS